MGGSGSKNQDYLADIASRYAAEKGLCRTTNQKKLCKYCLGSNCARESGRVVQAKLVFSENKSRLSVTSKKQRPEIKRDTIRAHFVSYQKV